MGGEARAAGTESASTRDFEPTRHPGNGQLNLVKHPFGRVRNRAAREHALVAAARRLFAHKGYEATTTREIASEAGCAEGLIHRYFQGKEGLLLAIVRSFASRQPVQNTDSLNSASRLEDVIERLLDAEMERAWEDREILRVLVPQALSHSDMVPVFGRIGPSRRAQEIRECLKAVRSTKGTSDDELDALAHFIANMGFMFGFVRPVVLGDDRTQAKALALTAARALARLA
jgi:AcrR family transcriptional regulator